MAAKDPRQRQEFARSAAKARWRPDAPETHAALRDGRAARLAENISSTVAAWPPLTPEQRDRLALLLRGGAA